MTLTHGKPGFWWTALTVTIPATIIPILIAAFAAYALAWMKLPGRGFIIAVIVAVAIYYFTSKTTAGYELVVTGANPRASKVHGIDIKKMFLFSMVIGAACAGLAGAIEVSGVHHRLIEGLHSNFATLGLIIGLMARGKNAAVPFVAFFISILEVGGSAMQRTVMVPVQIVLIAEALILIFILLSDIVKRRQK